MTIIYTALGLWAGWCLYLVLYTLFIVPITARRFSHGPFTNGFKVYGMESMRNESKLVQDAVWAHEQGHIRRYHVLKSLLRLFLFQFKDPPLTHEREEFEADDYAAACGYALPLANHLKKQQGQFNQERAARLIRKNTR